MTIYRLSGIVGDCVIGISTVYMCFWTTVVLVEQACIRQSKSDSASGGTWQSTVSCTMRKYRWSQSMYNDGRSFS
jgi:hypothetical protein